MDDGLQNKLTRFEETPPAAVWDKIAEALEGEENFAKRLYNYIQDPPVTIWSSVEKSLSGDAVPAKLIPFANRFKQPLRYVAAASIIGIIAITTTLLLKRTEAGALQAGNTGTVVSSTIQTIVPPPKQNKAIQNPIASASVVKETVTKNSTFKRKLLNLVQPQELLASVAVAGKFIPEKVIKDALFNNKLLDNYMVFCDGNGMAMRMPKKLFPLVNCEDGDGSCKQRIKSLQRKISSASLATDFGAVLEMLHEIQ